jgi:RNA polymerase sigma-54 factor
MRVSPREVLLGEEIIGNIDDDGYLVCSVDEVVRGVNEWAKQNGDEWSSDGNGVVPFTEAEGEEMLDKIQRFDPAGVAARDLRECILLQLQDQELEDTLTYRIVDEYFEELVNHRWSEISKELNISAKEVQTASDEISKLDPKPGLKHSEPPDNYITPDLIVDKIDGEYHVFLNDTSMPRLKLSKTYREIARDKSKFKGENKEFISNKLNSANWMIQAIEQRRQTMLKVMNFIVDRQREFFERGVQYLKPLTLREVAEVIDMHESTVSRVTNEKYVQTPRGVYHLKFFFSSGLSTTSGEDVSATGIKDKIKKLVEDEDPKDPYTDQAIVDILKEEGIKIARRTVAKYRDQLGILSARMRKRV